MTLGEVTAPGSVVLPTWPVSGVPYPSGRLIIVPSASYPTLLQAQLAASYPSQSSAIVVINAGKSGEHPHEGKDRLSEALTATRPEVLLLWEGANSLRLYGSDLPTDALSDMIVDARSRGVQVFVGNVPPTRLGLRLSQPLDQLQLINPKIAAMAAARGAVLVDVYSALLPDVNTLIGDDGLHPTEAGYKRIADVFFAAILANLEVK